MSNDKSCWLDEALSLSAPSIVSRAEAEEYLRPLLKRCHAKTRKTFWMWLRLQLSRTEETAKHLSWMRESLCPLEVEKSTAGFRYVVNGDVALIEVGDEVNPAIWKIPTERLSWALSLYPVSLRKLPAMESPLRKESRRLKKELTEQRLYMTRSQRDAFVSRIAELQDADRNSYRPTARYSLIKYVDGSERAVHRLFLDAGLDDEIAAVDGDFLNFATATIKLTFEASIAEGLFGSRRLGNIRTEQHAVPNLQVVNSPDRQQDFESGFLQVKVSPHGDIDDYLKIQPNSKWKTGVFGKIQDAGAFEPLTPAELMEHGMHMS